MVAFKSGDTISVSCNIPSDVLSAEERSFLNDRVFKIRDKFTVNNTQLYQLETSAMYGYDIWVPVEMLRAASANQAVRPAIEVNFKAKKAKTRINLAQKRTPITLPNKVIQPANTKTEKSGIGEAILGAFVASLGIAAIDKARAKRAQAKANADSSTDKKQNNTDILKSLNELEVEQKA